jgi:hypothetical protein
MAAVGPGLLDVATLTAGNWTASQKTQVEDAYFDERSGLGGQPLSREDFAMGLECCHLHLALQWIGWSRDWTPPPHEGRDWLEEAHRQVKKLAL